jgi:hypothetical protein
LQIDDLPTCSSTIHAVIPWGGRRSNSLDIFQLQCSRRHANKWARRLFSFRRRKRPP